MQILGTSNTKYLSSAYLGENKLQVTKVLKYTLKDTKDYIETITDADSPDVFVLHSLCNEIQDKSPETCTQDISETVDLIEQKFKDMKVLVSLGLPRSDTALNRKIEKTNVLIKEKLSNKSNIYLCDNTNLFYRGAAQHGILNTDGLHLSSIGTRKLGKNLKDALWDLLDLPQVLSVSRDVETTKDRYHNESGKYRNYSDVQRVGYQHRRSNLYKDGRRNDYPWNSVERFRQRREYGQRWN